MNKLAFAIYHRKVAEIALGNKANPQLNNYGYTLPLQHSLSKPQATTAKEPKQFTMPASHAQSAQVNKKQPSLAVPGIDLGNIGPLKNVKLNPINQLKGSINTKAQDYVRDGEYEYTTKQHNPYNTGSMKFYGPSITGSF